MTIYFISGLGADKRVFQKLKLSNAFDVVHLDWIDQRADETLMEYAKRLAGKINTGKPFILIGLSFGGMVATEIARLYHPLKTIIISSAPTRKQLPWFLRVLATIPVYKIIPASLLKSPNAFTYWLFGTYTVEEKKLLKQILRDTDGKYLKWAINAIVTWNNEEKPKSLIHIHGTNDNILPIKYAQPDITVEGGRHFMVFSMAEKMSELLNQEIHPLLSITDKANFS